MTSFLIITPFHNAERFIFESASRSLAQEYDDFRIVFIDDASTDQSPVFLEDAIELYGNTRCQHVCVERTARRRGPLQNTHEAILKYGRPEDVIVIVDGDDWLLHPDVLTIINDLYETNDCWLTYGGAVWKPMDKQTFRSAMYDDKEIAEIRVVPHEDAQSLHGKWKVHHLRTFRFRLYQLLGQLDPQWCNLKDHDGSFYKMAGDVAMTIPMLELCGSSRIVHVDANLYVYNLHDNNEFVIDWREQFRIVKDILSKPSFPRLSSLELQLPTHKISPSFVRPPRATTGDNQHISGWPFARRCLEEIRCSRSELLDDFVEQSFAYYDYKPSYKRPWIGIFHHPPQIPEFADRRHRLQTIFSSLAWQRNAEYLQGGIALSEYLAEYLRRVLSVPIAVVRHPMEEPATYWDEETFLTQRSHTLVQIGYYLRNTRAIHQLPTIPGFSKQRLLGTHLPYIRAYDARVREYWQHNSRRTEHGGVVERGFVTIAEYEKVMSRNVILTEVFDASANNVVLECMFRHTPLLINHHPAVVEYLGSDYPLYFRDFKEIPDLLETRRIIEAHRYLKAKNRRCFTSEAFISSVQDAIESFGGMANATRLAVDAERQKDGKDFRQGMAFSSLTAFAP